MNKAFTANINDRVTARGYLDENDQLIMLEPEGSGGNKYKTAKLTFAGNYDDFVSAFAAQILTVADTTAITSISQIKIGDVYTVPLYEDGLFLSIAKVLSSYTVSIEGSYTPVNPDGDEFVVYLITGDCTVTITTTGEA